MGGITTELSGLLSGLSIIQEGLSIGTNGHIQTSVGVEADAVDEAGMVLA